jgi:L-asparaginase
MLHDHSAVDIVVETVRRLEDDHHFNAGLGSRLQQDGLARLSASLSDGVSSSFSAVVNVQAVANPILLARHLLADRDRVLAGEGARMRARELGLQERDARTPRTLKAWKEAIEGHTGTVGAVALDTQGRLAAATSTGGRGMERTGRVSDSCTVAGNYATSCLAVSCTGIGEHIMDGALAARLCERVAGGQTLGQAVASLTDEMDRHEWKAGLIAVDSSGSWAAPHTTPAMTWVYCTAHTMTCNPT